MPSQTNEQALESLIEKALVGSSREERTASEEISFGGCCCRNVITSINWLPFKEAM